MKQRRTIEALLSLTTGIATVLSGCTTNKLQQEQPAYVPWESLHQHLEEYIALEGIPMGVNESSFILQNNRATGHGYMSVLVNYAFKNQAASDALRKESEDRDDDGVIVCGSYSSQGIFTASKIIVDGSVYDLKP